MSLPQRHRVPASLALLAALAAAALPVIGHEPREPREPREIRDDTREREDRSGSGREDRDREDREQDDREREDRSDSDDSDNDDSGKDRNRNENKSGSRHGRQERSGRGRELAARLRLERDERGGERIRGEVVVIGKAADLASIARAGYQVVDRSPLTALDAETARVTAPAGVSVESLMRDLARVAPAAELAPHHVYRTSAAQGGEAANAARIPTATGDARLGVIDTGVSAASSLLRQSLADTGAFAAGGYVPRDHGTAVADIAARGGARIFSADVFGLDEHDDLAATTLAIARAIDWLMRLDVPVINLSIDGPDNPILARVIRAALARDTAIVAAAGNRGPLAPPGYPAAYPGVIAVTAIDGKDRIYRRANQGDYIAFSARGVDLAVSGADGRRRRESGTSFAAPVVAAVLARKRSLAPAQPLAETLAELRNQARDLGAQGRDPVFGWGEIRADQRLQGRR